MSGGQIPKASIGKNIGLLHEVNDQLAAITPVTKWRRRVLEIADIPGAVREAVYHLPSGNPRPVGGRRRLARVAAPGGSARRRRGPRGGRPPRGGLLLAGPGGLPDGRR